MVVELKTILMLLIAFQLKQFAADFLFQTRYMLQKVRTGWDFLPPLLLHVTIHGLFTLAICLVYRPELAWLSLVDFSMHFTMDRVKVGPRYLGRYNNPATSIYWYCYGFDQMVHHLTHYLIIWALITL